MDKPDVSEVQRKLFADLQAARATCAEAEEECKRLLVYSEDLGLANLDDEIALIEARAIRKSSFERYSDALRAFTELVLHGTVPGQSNILSQNR